MLVIGSVFSNHILLKALFFMSSKKSRPSKPLAPESIRELSYGFQKSRIVLTAYELGIFTFLGGTGKTSSTAAAALGTDPRATDRLMNALCALGLLVKIENTFANTHLASRFLVKGKPEFITGMMHTVHLWDTWSTLTEAVKKGTSVYHRSQTNDHGKQWLSAFIAAMQDRAFAFAPIITGNMDLSNVKRVLDVGGGSGAYAVAFVRAKKGIEATVFDLPNVVPLTKKYVQAAGLSERIHFTEGDYTKHNLGAGFDLVFLSAIIHSNSEKENRRLIRKCAGALRPGGRVVVQDFIMDDSRTHPVHGAIFALNMLVGTKAGDTFTEAEVSAWMAEAGLTKIGRNDTPLGTTQIIGWKKK
jgi:ubiquinone/menaquinone biosynthesis C-methylase UbiE